MEITLKQMGQMIETLYKNNYFKSDSLIEAIATMKSDKETAFSLSFQFEHLDLQEQVLLKELLEKAKA